MTRGALLSLLLLSVGAFVGRLLLFLQSPEPVATDGYYYVVQVEDLVALGRLHVPDSSWVFYLLAVLHLLGLDPIVSVKVGASLLAALCVPAAYFLGWTIQLRFSVIQRVSVMLRSLGWQLALWAVLSPTLTGLAKDFPKNLGLVAPLLLLSGLVLKKNHTALSTVAAVLVALLVATAHRLGAGFLAIWFAVLLGGWLLGKGQRHLGGKIWWFVGAGVMLFVVLSSLLPGLLHPSDLERFSGQFQLSLDPPPPFAYFSLAKFPLLQKIELALCWVAFLSLIPLLKGQRNRAAPLAFGLLLLLCLFPLWRRDNLDMGYRLCLMAPVFATPLGLAGLLVTLQKSNLMDRIRPQYQTAAVVVAGVLALALLPLGNTTHTAPPYASYRKLINRIPQPLPKLLIAHQGINFLYDHVTGKEAMAWAPEVELSRQDIGRLVWGVGDGEWRYYAPSLPGLPKPVRIGPDYVYVREDYWELFYQQVVADQDLELLDRLEGWQNPTRVRPSSLTRHR